MDRLELVDALRGFALLGILCANMPTFALPARAITWSTLADKFAVQFVDIFVSGKFIILFSTLFGISFALQMQRLEARSLRHSTLFVRRQFGLLVLGVLHLLFLYFGDILVFYSVLGLCLMMFRRVRPPGLLIVIAFTAYALSFVPPEIERVSSEAAMQAPPSVDIMSKSEEAPSDNVYGSGSYWEILAQRFHDFLSSNPAASPLEYPRKFAFFLVGLYLVQCGFLQELGNNRRALSVGCILGGIVGMLATAALYVVYLPSAPAWASLIRLPLIAIQYPAMSLLYACLFILAIRRVPVLLRGFSAAGRTALSNYILQSVICTTIFYSYGFGLFGKVQPLELLELSVAIFVVEIFISTWWLSRYRFGPLEFLLRWYTYRRKVSV